MAAAALFGDPWSSLRAQGVTTVSAGPFELADAVQVDQIEHAVRAHVDRIAPLLADRQWNEAIDILCQLSETPDEKLVAVDARRYVGLREWCQRRLAALPPEALKIYRGRIDPAAKKWVEQGIAHRDAKPLQEVVDQALASSFGDDALMALGEMAFESGDFAAARRHWERIVPNGSPGHFPDTHLDLAAVRARLVLVSIVAGQRDRARGELAEFVRLHADAKGRLGGREGLFGERLQSLLAESALWPAEKSREADWPTFAGNPSRNKTAEPLVDVGVPLWRMALRPAAVAQAATDTKPVGEDFREPLSFYPLLIDGRVLVGDDRRIWALRRNTGAPAWGKNAVIYNSENADKLDSPTVGVFGVPRFTMTVFREKLFARLGSTLTGRPNGGGFSTSPGYLACLDLSAEGRLLWKITPEEGWAFDGSPVADDCGVYVAMRRQDIRPQAFVACFDADTGRLRWRRFVCGAETPPRGAMFEQTHNLLTLSGGTIYFNTNLGAVASLRADDGRLLWVSLYPRALKGDLTKLRPHWRRDLNPCICDRGTLYVAPADSPRIFAFDAATGQAIWQTGDEVEDATSLLGASGDWLIAGGGRLYWISLKEESRGRVKRMWPDGPERPGYGRGLLAGESVLWSTRDRLYIFDQHTARPQKVVDLAALGLSGGNLLVIHGQLLIATERELIAVGLHGGAKTSEKLKTEN